MKGRRRSKYQLENCSAVAAPLHLVTLDYFPEANISSFT
jgi:hypothetical protein